MPIVATLRNSASAVTRDALRAVFAAPGATRLGLTVRRFLPFGVAAVAAALVRPVFQWLMRGRGYKINGWAGLETYALAVLVSGVAVALIEQIGHALASLHAGIDVLPFTTGGA